MERRLAENLESLDTPLREAIRRLEGEKTLRRQKGGAIVVCQCRLRTPHILSVRRPVGMGEARAKGSGTRSLEEL